MATTIANDFNIGDTVYVRHDVEQFPRMVTSIIIDANGVTYELSSGDTIKEFYPMEISKEKPVF